MSVGCWGEGLGSVLGLQVRCVKGCPCTACEVASALLLNANTNSSPS